MYVPVVDKTGKPLMPTKAARARRWIEQGKATPFFKKGLFCVRLNVEPSNRKYQDVSVGIDPGSKKEGFTVKAEQRTFLNIQADALTWVKKKIKSRREARRTRRGRKCPHRKNRQNRTRGQDMPPSTKARWQWKLRLLNWLRKVYPITVVVVEDIKAKTKKSFRGWNKEADKRWNKSFSPLEQGKAWFYYEIQLFAELILINGWETARHRKRLKLGKTKNKLANVFEAHCVDSWILADMVWCMQSKPENKQMLLVKPIQVSRRQLHRFQPAKGGVRKPYGGTNSCGFKKGSTVWHPTHGFTYIGGSIGDRVSLHSLKTGYRLTQNAKPDDIELLTNTSWCTRLLPRINPKVSRI